MEKVMIGLVALFSFGLYFLFYLEWEQDFYDVYDKEEDVHTSLWDIITTKKIPQNYPLKKLRQKIEELCLLQEIEEDTEFFDDEYGYMLIVDGMDLLYRRNGKIGGAIIYASWHGLAEGKTPCEETVTSNTTVKISGCKAEKLIKSMEE